MEEISVWRLMNYKSPVLLRSISIPENWNVSQLQGFELNVSFVRSAITGVQVADVS